MGRPGGGGLLTPQAEGATWGGGAPHGGFPVGSAWALGGASTRSGHRSLASPPGLPVGDCGRGRELGEGPSTCPEGSHGRSPLHSTFGPLVLPVQVARRSPYSRANTPGTPEHMRVCTHAHTHAHTHTHVTLSVHPSTRSRSWARAGGTQRDPVITARQRQLGSVLTLMGARPAGRGPSRPRAPAAGWGRGQQVVSEHGVVSRGAGAGGVLAAWRVLLEGH